MSTDSDRITRFVKDLEKSMEEKTIKELNSDLREVKKEYRKVAAKIWRSTRPTLREVIKNKIFQRPIVVPVPDQFNSARLNNLSIMITKLETKIDLLKSDCNEVIFYGTFKEFFEYLKSIKFWETDQDAADYLENHNYFDDNSFGKYKVNFQEKSIGISGKGKLSSFRNIDNSPDELAISERTSLVIDSKGFTQEEINSSFAEIQKKLDEIQEKSDKSEIKEYSLRKIIH